MKKGKFIILLTFSILAGLFLAWIDSQPRFDDTGILVGLILIFSSLFSGLSGRKPWLTALAVGIWIPLHGIFISHNFGSLMAVAVAFVGAFAGYIVNRMVRPEL